MKPRADIKLTPATADHATLAARLIYDSGYHNFGYQYEGEENFCKLAAHMWGQPQAVWSHKWAIAAYAGDDMIGLELGWTADQLAHEETNFDVLAVEALGPDLAKRAGARWPYLQFLMPVVPDDAYYLSNLALVPETRGQRIGDLLLGNAFTNAKKAGLREVHLDVASTKPAVGFYKRMGMECRAETNMPPIAEHVPPHFRMVMDLTSWGD
ncbi:MAG: GNAT family N-acetyltransferase [Alphaproteobacteria bacterium]